MSLAMRKSLFNRAKYLREGSETSGMLSTSPVHVSLNTSSGPRPGLPNNSSCGVNPVVSFGRLRYAQSNIGNFLSQALASSETITWCNIFLRLAHQRSIRPFVNGAYGADVLSSMPSLWYISRVSSDTKLVPLSEITKRGIETLWKMVMRASHVSLAVTVRRGTASTHLVVWSIRPRTLASTRVASRRWWFDRTHQI